MKDRIAKAKSFYAKHKSPLLLGAGVAIGGTAVYVATLTNLPDLHLRVTEEQLMTIIENPNLELVFPVSTDFEITMAIPA